MIVISSTALESVVTVSAKVSAKVRELSPSLAGSSLVTASSGGADGVRVLVEELNSFDSPLRVYSVQLI